MFGIPRRMLMSEYSGVLNAAPDSSSILLEAFLVSERHEFTRVRYRTTTKLSKEAR